MAWAWTAGCTPRTFQASCVAGKCLKLFGLSCMNCTFGKRAGTSSQCWRDAYVSSGILDGTCHPASLVQILFSWWEQWQYDFNLAVMITTHTPSSAEQYRKDTSAKLPFIYWLPGQNKGVPQPPWLCSSDISGEALCEYKWKQMFFCCLFPIFQNMARASLERFKMLHFCTHNFLFPIKRKVNWQLDFQ